MAGLSLRCGDCGALLKSVEEAQEHAELTKHSNFSESTEAVLNLVCATCGKPCRTRTPIELEAAPKAASGSGESADDESSRPEASDFEHYQPREGEGRRRRKTRSRVALPLRYPLPVQSIARQQRNRPRAISSPNAGRRNVSPCGEKERGDIVNLRLYSVLGNSSIEAAINWVAEHEDDPDIDQMPLVCYLGRKCCVKCKVPNDKMTEANKPSLTPEEIKMKAQELRYLVHVVAFLNMQTSSSLALDFHVYSYKLGQAFMITYSCDYIYFYYLFVPTENVLIRRKKKKKEKWKEKRKRREYVLVKTSWKPNVLRRKMKEKGSSQSNFCFVY
ncbi:hypothetical protein BHM03_00011354 [Ensete ventricosum]|nr:hypothetical protein BHM03_00011354 [Ensete ventricosum]